MGNRRSSKAPKAKLTTRISTDDPPVHVGGVTYQLQLIHCGKERCKRLHGPYWYAFWKAKGVIRSKYIGKKLPADVQHQGEAEHGRWYREQTSLPLGDRRRRS